MKRAVSILLLLSVVVSLSAQSAERVDLEAIQKIRDEGLNRSQVMSHLFQLTDVHGPRLQGSPGIEAAAEWAMTTMREWGVQNVRQERFPFGVGWSLNNFHATMLGTQAMPIIAYPKAWSSGTGGMVRAEVVRPQITNAAQAELWKGKLRGKIVLTQPTRPVQMLEGRIVLRMTDKEIEEAMTPPATAPAGRAGGAGRAGRAGRAGGVPAAPPFNVNDFYQAEGVVALFDRGANTAAIDGGSGLSWTTQRTDGGTIVLGAGGSRVSGVAGTGLPQVTVAIEHYNRMVRLLDEGLSVTVELNVDVAFHPEAEERPNGFNILGEIPGTDLRDEIVLIGAHFDSWHAATGATDNATGSSAMMEVLRIIRATGLQPRRTIRIALWGAEEQGLIGSRLYAQQYLGTPDAPGPEQAKHSAYFNIDNGTGKIRGVWMQGNPHVAPIFAAWAAPLKDLGVEIFSPWSVSSTDHTSIERAGVPGFQFVQDRLEYRSRTHHSNMDFYDRVQPEDMKQMATVAAVFAYQAAMRDAPLPRK